jgi:hypothetical protein
LQKVRGLSVTLPKGFDAQLVQLCAGAGVAVAFTRELPNTHVSGAARWLTPRKAILQITLRYKTDDQFWFTFFHEAAHILLHGKRQGVFIDKNDPMSDTSDDVIVDGATEIHDERIESEANDWASNFLIPDSELKKLPRPPLSKQSIVTFATRLGISPGILVGRAARSHAPLHAYERSEEEAGLGGGCDEATQMNRPEPFSDSGTSFSVSWLKS